MIRKAEKHRADEMIYQEIEDAQKKTQIIQNTYWFMCLLAQGLEINIFISNEENKL